MRPEKETDSRVFAVNGGENSVEVGSTEVCCSLESGEHAATWHSLEMFFTDVLQTNSQQRNRCSLPTNLTYTDEMALSKIYRNSLQIVSDIL